MHRRRRYEIVRNPHKGRRNETLLTVRVLLAGACEASEALPIVPVAALGQAGPQAGESEGGMSTIITAGDMDIMAAALESLLLYNRARWAINRYGYTAICWPRGRYTDSLTGGNESALTARAARKQLEILTEVE